MAKRNLPALSLVLPGKFATGIQSSTSGSKGFLKPAGTTPMML
jgi:hypothetical protein